MTLDYGFLTCELTIVIEVVAGDVVATSYSVYTYLKISQRGWTVGAFCGVEFG